MDFYKFAHLFGPVIGSSSVAFFAGAFVYRARCLKSAFQPARYRGLTSREWLRMAMSRDPAIRVSGYEGLSELDQVDSLTLLFAAETEEWGKFCCGYYLARITSKPTAAVTSFVDEYLYNHYGACSIEEWLAMDRLGIDLQNPKAYTRARNLFGRSERYRSRD